MFSSKVMTILAIVATLCFAAVVALQVLEFTHYSAEPSVWPAVVR